MICRHNYIFLCYLFVFLFKRINRAFDFVNSADTVLEEVEERIKSLSYNLFARTVGFSSYQRNGCNEAQSKKWTRTLTALFSWCFLSSLIRKPFLGERGGLFVCLFICLFLCLFVCLFVVGFILLLLFVVVLCVCVLGCFFLGGGLFVFLLFCLFVCFFVVVFFC